MKRIKSALSSGGIKRSTSVRLHSDVKTKISIAMERSGYSQRKLSTWICEAIIAVDDALGLESGDDAIDCLRILTNVGIGPTQAFVLSAKADGVLISWDKKLKEKNHRVDDLQTKFILFAINLRLDRGN